MGLLERQWISSKTQSHQGPPTTILDHPCRYVIYCSMSLSKKCFWKFWGVWISTFHFCKIGECYGIFLHYRRESLHLFRICRLAWNCHLHIVMILLHMTILECWVELVELRAKLLSIFWCCADWPCQTFNPTFGLLGFGRTTTLFYSQGFFWAEKKKRNLCPLRKNTHWCFWTDVGFV